MGATPLLPLYSLLFPRFKTCKDGKLGLKAEEDGMGDELATLGRVIVSEVLGTAEAP